jgi:hypothetical protein
LKEKSHKKYHDPCVLFLDDCFCNDDLAAALVAAGFAVQQFTAHFQRAGVDEKKREQGVKDPKVIALSHRQGWLILTADRHMRIAHLEDFKKHPNAMVLSTAHHDGNDDIWLKAIISAKLEIERKFKKQLRPWYAQISQAGEITVCETIDCQAPPKAKGKGNNINLY